MLFPTALLISLSVLLLRTQMFITQCESTSHSSPIMRRRAWSIHLSADASQLLALQGGRRESKREAKDNAPRVAAEHSRLTTKGSSCTRETRDNETNDDHEHDDSQENAEEDDGFEDDFDEDDQKSRSHQSTSDQLIIGGIKQASNLLSLAMRASKYTLKSVTDFATNKHVTPSQVVGKWRVLQTLEFSKEDSLSYPVSIELFRNGTVRGSYNGQIFDRKYTFRERQWPQRCQIEFDLPTYRENEDAKTPVIVLTYKGYFKRSLLNPKLVFVKGKIYRNSGGIFWNQKTKFGRFVANKRRYA